MEHQELTDLTSTLHKEVSPEQLDQGLTMSVEAKINDISIVAGKLPEHGSHFDAFGIDWTAKQQQFEVAYKALRSAETLYTTIVAVPVEAIESWQQHREGLYQWRAEATARLSFHAKRSGDAALQKSLDKISEGEGHLDAIQDGHELLELCQNHKESLAVNNLSEARLEEAAMILQKVTEAYPKVSAGAAADKSAKELRDRAFWYCCELERELKEEILPLVFWDDYGKRMEYASQYRREMNKKYKAAKAKESEESLSE